MTRIIGTGEFASSKRQRIFRFAVIAVASIFILRLGWLQIVKGGAYRLKAEAQSIKQIKREPFRGIMFDRNGRAIVQNVASFTVTVTPIDITDDAIQRLSLILDVPDSVITAKVAKARRYNRFNPAKLASGRDIPSDVLANLEEYS